MQTDLVELRSRPTRSGRLGFSLLELLVVIGIVGILTALSVGVVMRMIPAQQQANTENTVRKAYALLERHWKAVIDDARDDARKPAGIPQWVVQQLAGGDINRAKVIWIKLQLRRQFPMNFHEALMPNYFPGDPQPNLNLKTKIPAEEAYVNYMRQFGITYNDTNYPAVINTIPAVDLPEHTAACLLMILTIKSRRGVTSDQGTFGTTELAPTYLGNTTGPKQLVDDWSHPLVLFRSPTANAELADLNRFGNNAIQFRDPQDPEGRLQDPRWRFANGVNGALTPPATWFTSMCHPIVNMNLIPVIASAGADVRLEIQPPPNGANAMIGLGLSPSMAVVANNRTVRDMWGAVYPSYKNYFKNPNPNMSATMATNDNIYSYNLK